MSDKLMLMTVTLLAHLTELGEKRKSERGATATEYGLLVGLIAVIITVGVAAFGGALNDYFNALSTKVGSWTL